MTNEQDLRTQLQATFSAAATHTAHAFGLLTVAVALGAVLYAMAATDKASRFLVAGAGSLEIVTVLYAGFALALTDRGLPWPYGTDDTDLEAFVAAATKRCGRRADFLQTATILLLLAGAGALGVGISVLSAN